MGNGGKEALMDSPPLYADFPVPKIPCCPIHFKKLLCIVLVVVFIVIVIVVAILMGLFMTQKHTESIFQMSLSGPDGKDSQMRLPTDRKEGVATFYIRSGVNSSATVVYDYNNLVTCYRPWPGRACYISKMDEDDIPSLEAITKEFQNMESKPQRERGHPGHHALPDQENTARMGDSLLGTTVRVLCSGLPLIWA
ncbi:surfactant protein C [Ambystoma mexicanum]|uniref:surfactant protein C n=1 Tax=Ambystoma mexicanum TaxID=8296 RepID=UPI0037E8E2D0